MPDVENEPFAPCGLVIQGKRDRDGFLLVLHGELDIATSPVLERRLQLAQASGAEKLVLDMSGLQFLDSAGLHTLVAVQDQVRASGRSLTLLRGPRAVQRVFELTHSEHLFNFEG